MTFGLMSKLGNISAAIVEFILYHEIPKEAVAAIRLALDLQTAHGVSNRDFLLDRSTAIIFIVMSGGEEEEEEEE